MLFLLFVFVENLQWNISQHVVIQGAVILFPFVTFALACMIATECQWKLVFLTLFASMLSFWLSGKMFWS